MAKLQHLDRIPSHATTQSQSYELMGLSKQYALIMVKRNETCVNWEDILVWGQVGTSLEQRRSSDLVVVQPYPCSGVHDRLDEG